MPISKRCRTAATLPIATVVRKSIVELCAHLGVTAFAKSVRQPAVVHEHGAEGLKGAIEHYVAEPLVVHALGGRSAR